MEKSRLIWPDVHNLVIFVRHLCFAEEEIQISVDARQFKMNDASLKEKKMQNSN